MVSMLTYYFSKHQITVRSISNFEIHVYAHNGLDCSFCYQLIYVEASAMQELLQALGSINDAIEYMQNDTESIFQVSVNGVDYTLENTTLDFVGTVMCPNGYAGADGLCGTTCFSLIP
jgi:hypothetical protein